LLIKAVKTEEELALKDKEFESGQVLEGIKLGIQHIGQKQ
jgi:hypothetical protein